MSVLRFVLFALLAQASAIPQQPQPPATASIEGIVVRLGTNQPIANADVELTRVEGTAAAPLAPGAADVLARALIGGGNSQATPPPAIANEVRYFKTGADGKFSFTNLKEGKYRLVSIWIGGTYHPAEYGQKNPRGRGLNFPVSEGEAVRNARLEMAPTGTITGRVLDKDGQPMGHVSVMALEPMMQNGRQYLAIMEAGHTDERGEYRLFWLSPGRYYVAARVEDLQRRSVPMYVIPPGRGGMNERASSPVIVKRRLPGGDLVEETFALVYHGGVLTPDQSRQIEIQPGQTYAGVDIPVQAGTVPAFHIRGTVLDPVGKPARANVIAIPREWSPHVFVLNASADATGNFDLSGAVQGTYSVFATASTALNVPENLLAAAAAAGIPLSALGGPTITTGIGMVPVDVANADANGVRISTSPGLNLTGHVSIEGRPPNVPDADLARIRITLARDPDIMMTPPAMMQLPPPLPNTPPQPTNGQVLADGAFKILAAPGTFRVNLANLPAPNAYVKSMRMGIVDVLGSGLQLMNPPESSLDIVIGTDAGEITGTVQNDRGEAVTNAVVAIVPEALALRQRIDLFRTVTTDQSGRFRLQTVAPGNYKLFSWEYADAEIWQDPQFLQPYETFGRSVLVRENGRQDLQVSVIPVRR